MKDKNTSNLEIEKKFNPEEKYKNEEWYIKSEENSKKADDVLKLLEEKEKANEERAKAEKDYWLDENIEKRMENYQAVKYFQTKVYNKTFAQGEIIKEGSITIELYDLKEGIKPLILNLSQESFIIIKEAIDYSIKEFGIDLDQQLNNLTNNLPIEFKKTISPTGINHISDKLSNSITKETSIDLLTDENLELKIENENLRAYFQSRIYQGRFIQGFITKGEKIQLYLAPFQQLFNGKSKKLDPVSIYISKENLVFLKLIFEYAIKEFEIDSISILDKLTNGKGVEFKKERNTRLVC